MTKVKAPTWFLIISILALLWNILGASAFISDLFKSEEAIAAMDPMMQAFYRDVPWWSMLGYGVATIFGFLGSLGLVIKKKWAQSMFVISLLGLLVNNFHTFVTSGLMDEMGSEKYIMPTVVIGIAILLLFLAKKGIEKRWLV